MERGKSGINRDGLFKFNDSSVGLALLIESGTKTIMKRLIPFLQVILNMVFTMDFAPQPAARESFSEIQQAFSDLTQQIIDLANLPGGLLMLECNSGGESGTD